MRMNAYRLARVNASGQDEKQRAARHIGSSGPTASIMMKGQLLAVFQHTMDPTFMPLFLAEVRDTKQSSPSLRIGANSAYAFRQRGAETLRALISAEASNVDGATKGARSGASRSMPPRNATKTFRVGRASSATRTIVRRKAPACSDASSKTTPPWAQRSSASRRFRDHRLARPLRAGSRGLQGSEAIRKIEELLQKERGTVMGRASPPRLRDSRPPSAPRGLRAQCSARASRLRAKSAARAPGGCRPTRTRRSCDFVVRGARLASTQPSLGWPSYSATFDRPTDTSPPDDEVFEIDDRAGVRWCARASTSSLSVDERTPSRFA